MNYVFQYFKFQLGDAKVFFYVRGQNLPFTETTLQAYENIWNFADDLSWKYYQNSHILQMDLPRSLPCIRNLVVLSQCPEVIACIIIHGLFCTLQMAFSPQEHSSFTPTGGSGGGGVISVSVECFCKNIPIIDCICLLARCNNALFLVPRMFPSYPYYHPQVI